MHSLIKTEYLVAIVAFSVRFEQCFALLCKVFSCHIPTGYGGTSVLKMYENFVKYFGSVEFIWLNKFIL